MRVCGEAERGCARRGAFAVLSRYAGVTCGLREERGCREAGPAGGDGSGGGAAKRSDLPGVGGAVSRVGERRHYAQGGGIPAKAGLPERLLREEGATSVRTRSTAIPGWG